MEILADIMLGIGAIGAAIYCMVLSRRLRRFNNLQNGMGGAVAVLSAQVDDMTKMLDNTQGAAAQSATVLTDLTKRAEASAQKLELMMASLHDLPDKTETSTTIVDDASSGIVASANTGDEGARPLFFSQRERGARHQ